MILSSIGNCSHSLYVYSMISIPIKVGMCGGEMYRYCCVVNHRDSLQSKFATLDQFDQIGRFIALRANFQSLLATINLPKSP